MRGKQQWLPVVDEGRELRQQDLERRVRQLAVGQQEGQALEHGHADAARTAHRHARSAHCTV